MSFAVSEGAGAPPENGHPGSLLKQDLGTAFGHVLRALLWAFGHEQRSIVGMARDKLAEIAARRARNGRGGSWRGKSELDQLVRQWHIDSGTRHIAPQFVAIRLVTILEVFTRDWVAQLVDAGDPYTGLGADLVKGSLKIDYVMAQALVGKRVTFGELVSHEIPVNDIADIDRAFSTLLEGSLFANLAGVVDRGSISDGEGESVPILADPPWARAQIARLFAARHIIVHELPNDRDIGLETIDDFVRATSAFVEVADQYFDKLLHGDYPVTQIGLNAWAAEKADTVNIELKNILEELDPDGSNASLIAAQVAWEDYRLKQANYRADYYRGGSMAPMVFSDEIEKITRERVERLRWFLEREEGDM